MTGHKVDTKILYHLPEGKGRYHETNNWSDFFRSALWTDCRRDDGWRELFYRGGRAAKAGRKEGEQSFGNQGAGEEYRSFRYGHRFYGKQQDGYGGGKGCYAVCCCHYKYDALSGKRILYLW